MADTYQAPITFSRIAADEVPRSSSLGLGGVEFDGTYFRLTDAPSATYGIAIDPDSGYARLVTLPHAGAKPILRITDTLFTL
jgi:hypothetical protein